MLSIKWQSLGFIFLCVIGLLGCTPTSGDVRQLDLAIAEPESVVESTEDNTEPEVADIPSVSDSIAEELTDNKEPEVVQAPVPADPVIEFVDNKPEVETKETTQELEPVVEDNKVQNSAKPEIISFTSNVAQLNPGEVATISWEAVGEEVYLCYTLLDWSLECDPVAISGTIQLESNDGGSLVQRQLKVVSGDQEALAMIEIPVNCLYTWHATWESTNPTSMNTCPDIAYTPSSGVAQRFEQGIMIWVEATQQIFVYTDSGNYYRVNDGWTSEMPAEDASLTPPTGYYQPTRGFGKVWRENDTIREALGWAIEDEFSFETALQCAVSQSKLGSFDSCYLLGLENIYMNNHHSFYTKWPLG